MWKFDVSTINTIVVPDGNILIFHSAIISGHTMSSDRNEYPGYLVENFYGSHHNFGPDASRHFRKKNQGKSKNLKLMNLKVTVR